MRPYELQSFVQLRFAIIKRRLHRSKLFLSTNFFNFVSIIQQKPYAFRVLFFLFIIMNIISIIRSLLPFILKTIYNLDIR